MILLVAPFSGMAGEALTGSGPAEAPEWVMRVEPLGLLYGIYGASAELGVSSRVTLGLIGEFFSPAPGFNRVWVYEGGVVSTIYLSGPRFRSGWFVQPAVEYVSGVETRLALDLRTGHYVGTATGGYEWDWGGPSLLLGAGVSGFSSSGSAGSAGSAGIEPVLNLQAGWVF